MSDIATGSPAPLIVSLRTQLASQGHTKDLLASSDSMTVHIHCYAPKGGENGMHAHTQEDHVFVCLQGEAVFRGIEGTLPPLRRNQAIFLAKGCFYSFSNESEEPCILLRVGAGERARVGERLDPNGAPIAGRGKQENAVKPVLIENAFFE